MKQPTHTEGELLVISICVCSKKKKKDKFYDYFVDAIQFTNTCGPTDRKQYLSC